MHTTVEQLTRGLPEEFMQYIQYCRGLKFKDEPDYNYLRDLLNNLLTKRGTRDDQQFDWILKKARLPIDQSEYAGYKRKLDKPREKEFGELGKLEEEVQEIARIVKEAA